MEPRPEGRGDMPQRERSGSVVSLQWSRGPKAAETLTRGWCLARALPLQWSRGPKAAETRLPMG